MVSSDRTAIAEAKVIDFLSSVTISDYVYVRELARVIGYSAGGTTQLTKRMAKDGKLRIEDDRIYLVKTDDA